MYEPASTINDYLPKYGGSETPYMQHLWGAFEAVMNSEKKEVQAFGLLPFHLLFMFALQYKVFRISAYNERTYLTTLKQCKTYGKTNMITLEMNAPKYIHPRLVNPSASVKNLSLMHESNLFDFFTIVNAPSSVIEKGKVLVEYRSNYAHANGNIEPDIEGRLDEYLEVLSELQPSMLALNDEVADEWDSLQLSQEDLEATREPLLRDNFLCAKDFENGKLTKYSIPLGLN